MTHVWLHSVGPGLEPLLSSVGARIAAELGYKGYVEKWVPFTSKSNYQVEHRSMLLLVSDWGSFSRSDYFIAANALALHESGIVLLLPVIVTGAEVTHNDDEMWLERYRAIWQRLRALAIMTVHFDEVNALTHELAAKVLSASLAHSNHANDTSTQPATLFFSYCHRDQELRDKLAQHLKPLERIGLIEGWHDRKILAGEEWSAAIDAHLYTADFILLLLSSDFFASDYCSDIEAPIALKRHKAKAARTIPIVLRPVMWRHSPLAALQALPTDARPITSWESTDSAFVNVCEGIVSSLLAGKSQTPDKDKPPAALESLTRKRVFDCAMPAAVEVDKSFMLVVLVRKLHSEGLRALLASDSTYGVDPGDVRSEPLSLEFPIDETKKPKSINVRITVSAPDFSPPEQTRTLHLDPDKDSQPLIFMLSAKRTGTLGVVLEIYNHDELVGTYPLRTHAQLGTPAKQAPQMLSGEFTRILKVTDGKAQRGPAATSAHRPGGFSQRLQAAASRESTLHDDGRSDEMSWNAATAPLASAPVRPGSRHIDLDDLEPPQARQNPLPQSPMPQARQVPEMPVLKTRPKVNPAWNPLIKILLICLGILLAVWAVNQ